MSAFKASRPFVTWVILVFVILAVFAGVDVYRTNDDIHTLTFNLWFHHSRYDRVRQGMTKAQVKLILGSPNSERANNMSYQIWRYEASTPLPNTSKIYDPASVFFGSNGRVTSVTSHPKSNKIWPNGEPKPGMTMQQVKELAGKPQQVIQSKVVTTWWYQLWNGARFGISFDRNGKVSLTSLGS